MVSLPVLEPVMVWLLAPAVMLKFAVEAWALRAWLSVFRPVTVIMSVASPPSASTLPLPVVMVMPSSAALAVVTLRVPLRLAPVRLPTRLVTTCLAAPKKLSRVFWARAAALVVTVSPLPLAVSVVAPLPVVTPMVLSAASPVVTARVPEVPLANTEPVRLVTVKSLVLALPVRVRLALSARLAALTVRS